MKKGKIAGMMVALVYKAHYGREPERAGYHVFMNERGLSMKRRPRVLGYILAAALMSAVLVPGCAAEETKEIPEEQKDYADSSSQAKDVQTWSARIYYVDDQTGDVTGKNVDVQDENDIWTALQENGILTEECRLLDFQVNESEKTIDLDFSSEVGDRIRSMGTAGETQIIGCLVNTYLEAYSCDGIRLTEEGETLETSHGGSMDGYSGMMTF